FGLVTTSSAVVRLSESGTTAAVEPNTGLFPVNFIPDKVAITPGGTLAYITDRTQPLVARFDILKGTAPGAVRVLQLDGTKPEALAITPDGRFVFVVQGDSTGLKGLVSRIDVGTNQVKSVEVQGRPVALAISTNSRCICPAGKDVCSGRCVSLDTDRKNCGRCGIVCPTNDVCSSGRCICPRENDVCNNVCVNPETDTANCGECGRKCAPGET